MITDEERHEVAERLRDMNPEDFNFPYGKPVFEHIFESVFPNQMVLTNWILRVPLRLADLIERQTCRNVSGYQDVFECSECRCRVELITEVCNEHGEPFSVPLIPSWCPNCGAAVTEED